MNKLIALVCVLSSAALSGCACLGIGSASTASAASAASAGKTTSMELDIKFEIGKDDITPQYNHQLQRVNDFMRLHPESRAEIKGYADVTGDSDDNRALSLRRAHAVRNALIERFSLDGARLTAAGYGERPFFGTGSVAERAENRRVLATFTGHKN